jgi:hypothetical protein
METKYQRNLQSGENFNHFFPKANGKNITIKGNADVSHTLALIPKVVHETLHHTAQLAQHLKANNLNETCKNIWDFVYQHIAYRKDEDGKEQVRSPARVWQDRKQGVDCDCYTTFISSILTNLNIPHVYRITKYFKPHFQHIYPIVPLSNGKYITIDCVVEQYNYEEPFSEKKDTPMDLQYLNGIEQDEPIYTAPYNVDVEDLLGFETGYPSDELSEVGELGRRRKKNEGAYEPRNKTKVGKVFRKVIHIANKANPATVLLRNGVLASMKLNIFKVAQRLKWAYLSDADAKRKGVDTAKFERLKKVRAKVEGIYFSCGGKPENLKNAILKGKGNKGHDVNGFDGYEDDELSELGEPATGTAIASATAVMTTIAGILKNIGHIFPPNDEASQDFEHADIGAEQGANSTTSLAVNKTAAPSLTDEGKANPESNIAPQTNSDTESNSASMMKVANQEENDEDDPKKKTGEGVWDKNKKWMQPALIGVGGVGLLALGYKIFMSHKPTSATRPKPQAVNGVPKRKKARQKKQVVQRKSLF